MISPREENGQALVLRDLLRLHKTFRASDYRVDLVGFLAAWLLVGLMIAGYYWLGNYGAN